MKTLRGIDSLRLVEWPREDDDLPLPPVERFGYAGGDLLDRCVAAVLCLGQRTLGRFVLFWWEPFNKEMAWLDDRGALAIGGGNDWAWLNWRRKLRTEYEFGGDDRHGREAVFWDRRTGKIYIASQRLATAWLWARAQQAKGVA
jgi:hypothetical protein